MNNVVQSYAILEIPSTASIELTKQAYRKLAKIWHPDRYFDDPILKARAEEKIKQINQAYAVIKNHQQNNSVSAVKVKTSTYCAAKKSSTKVAKTQHTIEFYYQQGINYFESEDYEGALNSLTQAIELDPDYIEAYQCRGFVLSMLGYDLRADADFKQARRIKLERSLHKGESSNFSPPSDRNSTQGYSHSNLNQLSLQLCRTIADFDWANEHIAITDNGQIAIANKAEIELWQIDTGKRIGILKGHTDTITCLTTSFDGRILISGSQDKSIKFWNLATQKIIRTFGGHFDGHLGKVTALALSSNNQTLISCGADNSLKIWNMNRAKETHSFAVDEASCLAISSDNRLFCSGSLDPHLRIRSVQTGQVIRSINNNSGILSIAFSPDGNLLAAGSFNGKIGIWDIITGQKIYSLSGHAERISKVIFSHDGKTLISSSWDKTIRLWKLAEGKQIGGVDAHSHRIYNMAISPKSLLFASSSEDKTVKLWRCNL